MNWTSADWARLGTHLREAREAQGLSRRVLANKTGISEKAIQVAEDGRTPSARWPKSVDALAEALGWETGAARIVLNGGHPPVKAAERPNTGPKNLASRMADNQIRMATDRLVLDADRLASAARHYADDLRRGTSASGGAYQLAQAVADMLRQASRLDGMNDIAALIDPSASPVRPDEEPSG